MRLIDKLAGALGYEKRARLFVQSATGGLGLFSGIESEAGEPVSQFTALEVSAVWACVRVITRQIARTPWVVYRRQEGRARTIEARHPVYKMIHYRPNPEMSSIDFRETLQLHALLWRGGYAEIERNRAGMPIALWPIRPDRVEIRRNERGQLYYRVTNIGDPSDDEMLPAPSAGRTVDIPARDMFHVKGMSYNGVEAESLIEYARNSIGVALAGERYAGRAFKNDARPGLLLKHPGVLGDAARLNLQKSVEENYGGKNRGRPMVLEEGMDAKDYGVTPRDAEAVSSRVHQIREICRWFGVPPHKIYDLERATFTNIEHQSLEFIGDAISPWAAKWDQEASWKLLSNPDLYTEMQVDTLAQADMKSRWETYRIALSTGAMTVNEVREVERMNPSTAEGADKHWFPVNMQADDAPSGELEPGIDPVGVDDRHRELLDDAVFQVLQRERNALDGKKTRTAEWASEWYGSHRDWAAARLRPVVRAVAATVGIEDAEDALVESLDALYGDPATRMAWTGVPEADATETALRIVEAIERKAGVVCQN